MKLDVQLWELGTQRLHQELSKTILVNTLTDVREFKKGESQTGTFFLTPSLPQIEIGDTLPPPQKKKMENYGVGLDLVTLLLT